MTAKSVYRVGTYVTNAILYIFDGIAIAAYAYDHHGKFGQTSEFLLLLWTAAYYTAMFAAISLICMFAFKPTEVGDEKPH